MKAKNAKNQVRIKPVLLYVAIAALGVMIGISIWSRELFWSFMAAVPFAFAILNYVNTKILYDESGITLSDMLGQKCFIPWRDVITVEDTVDTRSLTFGKPTKILMIKYRATDGKTESSKWDHSLHIGLYDLLFYFQDNILKK